MSSFTSGGDKTVDAQQYQQGWDDLEADMVLESSDKKLFRVHSYYHKAASAYFRSMPSPSESPSGHDKSMNVPIAGDGEDLARLLDFLISPKPEQFYRWREVKPVLKLAAHYQFERFPAKVVPLVEGCMSHDAWAVFTFASQHNLPSLAKHAVGRFPGDSSQLWKKSTNIDTLSPSWFVDVASPYSVALLQAMAKNSTENRGNIKVDWSGVAADFQVV